MRHLSHQLVEAFRSTLEEVADSDLIIHVDGSNADPEGQIAAVREVFAEIGAEQVPKLIVVNKSDAADPLVVARLLARERYAVVVSARTGEGVTTYSPPSRATCHDRPSRSMRSSRTRAGTLCQ